MGKIPPCVHGRQCLYWSILPPKLTINEITFLLPIATPLHE